MAIETVDILEIDEDLIINNIENIKKKIISHLGKHKSLELNLSKTNRIDISGLQLLISLVNEVKGTKKSLVFSGNLTENFTEEVNRISFSHLQLTTGEELKGYIDDTV